MSNLESVKRWVEESPYSRALGLQLESADDASVRLYLPYSDSNSNPGKALHGGVAASLSAIGGQAMARLALGDESGPWVTAGLQVNYLSAAIGEDVIAQATLLRRGKELCFAEVSIETVAGKAIAHATTAVRGRFGAPPPQLAKSAGDHGRSDPGAMGPHVGKLPFMKGRGIDVEHMTGGTSRIVMPRIDANLDLSGDVHEGAALALLDTTGAMASWAETGPGRYKASTPALQAKMLAPPPCQELVAYGRMLQRDGELFWSDVEVTGAEDGLCYARGTVIYRIVT